MMYIIADICQVTNKMVTEYKKIIVLGRYLKATIIPWRKTNSGKVILEIPIIISRGKQRILKYEKKTFNYDSISALKSIYSEYSSNPFNNIGWA